MENPFKKDPAKECYDLTYLAWLLTKDTRHYGLGKYHTNKWDETSVKLSLEGTQVAQKGGLSSDETYQIKCAARRAALRRRKELGESGIDGSLDACNRNRNARLTQRRIR